MLVHVVGILLRKEASSCQISSWGQAGSPSISVLPSQPEDDKEYDPLQGKEKFDIISQIFLNGHKSSWSHTNCVHLILGAE